MNTMIDEETVLQSHREWIEDREREQQERDRKAVERFLVGKLRIRSKDHYDKCS